MVSKPQAREGSIRGPETLDEGWWAAILTEDETVKPRSPMNLIDVPPLSMADSWTVIQRAYAADQIVCLTVSGYNRGGLLVQGDQVQGFVPLSHLIDIPNTASEAERRELLSAYVGRVLQLKVIECQPEQKRAIFSERAAQAGEGRRRALFETLIPGAVVSGTVTNLTEFGAFIDLGGVEGLVHVSELSWGRVQHPTDILTLGELVRVLVLQINCDNCRIALSLKRLSTNPWERAMERYQPGDVVPAEITTTTRFGAFARLEEGIEGLIHISTVPNSNRSNLRALLVPGRQVHVRILRLDADRRRLGLGLVKPE